MSSIGVEDGQFDGAAGRVALNTAVVARNLGQAQPLGEGHSPGKIGAVVSLRCQVAALE